jgi:hypothetical protein
MSETKQRNPEEDKACKVTCPDCHLTIVHERSQPTDPVPAVPAQEAPRWCPSIDSQDGRHLFGDRQCAFCGAPAEPQAGAQVPSQDEPDCKQCERMAEDYAGLLEDNFRLEHKLAAIKSYATEAAKTPGTRESILAAQKSGPIPDNLQHALTTAMDAQSGRRPQNRMDG